MQTEKEADFYSTIAGGAAGSTSSDEAKTTGLYLHYYPGFYIDGSVVDAQATASTNQQITVSSSILSAFVTEYVVTVSRTVNYELTRSAFTPTPLVGSRPLKTTIATAYYTFGGGGYGIELTELGETIISHDVQYSISGTFYTAGVFRLVTPKSADSDTQTGQYSETEIHTYRVSKSIGSIDALQFSNSVPIKPDPGTVDALFDTSKPHYLDSNQDGTPEQRHPVLYAASTIPAVDATFKMAQGASGQYLVKGTATDGFFFEGSGIVSNGMLSVQGMQAKTAFGAALTKSFRPQVKKYDDFAITWTLTPAAGGAPISAGASLNTLYVSAAAPQTTNLFHSVVDIAVRNAKDISTNVLPSVIIDAIWTDFDDNSVVREDGEPLHYYLTPDNNPTETAGLLAAKTGQCRSWVTLFLDALAVHGIVGGENVWIKALNPDEEMLIRNFTFAQVGPLQGTYPFFSGYLTQTGIMVGGFPTRVNGQPWPIANVVPASGISGQSMFTPTVKIFENHQVAHINNRYYDPSYGEIYTGLQDFESEVQGFAIVADNLTIREDELGIDIDGDAANDPGYACEIFKLNGNLVRKNEGAIDLKFAESKDYPSVLTTPALNLASESGVGTSRIEPNGFGGQSLAVQSKLIGNGNQNSLKFDPNGAIEVELTGSPIASHWHRGSGVAARVVERISHRWLDATLTLPSDQQKLPLLAHEPHIQREATNPTVAIDAAFELVTESDKWKSIGRQMLRSRRILS